MAKTFKRELLEKVAAELNEVFGLNPPIQADMPDDDTLLTTVVHEAIGKGVVNDALRADDFVTANPEKKTFSKEAHEFFIAAGVWDAKAQKVVMPAEYCAQPEEGEAEAQTEMEAGEEAAPAPAAAAKKANKSKTKAAPAKPAAAEKEEPKVKEKTTAVRAAITKKTATAKKRAAKTTKTVKAPAQAKHISTPKGTGVGVLCRELITKHPDKGNEDIAVIVRAKLKTETPAASVAWYRNQMKAGKKAKKK